MNKADWSIAPDWAQWHTTDNYGRAWWAVKPGWLSDIQQYGYPIDARDPRCETYNRLPHTQSIESRPKDTTP